MIGPESAAGVFPGADEKTPSRAQYFSWINNTNEGPTEAQTLANLGFFRWLRDEYGMRLDIYAFDAGAIDGARFYGSTDSERFRRQFPNGFSPAYEAARSFGCRLGIWGGPDGFGDTPEEEDARIEMMVSLCRDYEFALFKVDGVCGQLRESKQDAFVKQMTECRKHSPDLILLNHRLKLGKGLPHATTFLWEGAETYIDVHMVNRFTATHNRACALARGLPPEMHRLTEDHGVCLSSCLDFWEDDLVLQAFNRCLILAPELYGNPWLLRDDELPRMARIFNLHRRYREILVEGIVLPEESLGPHAVSRGDGRTRFITLRNISWEPVTRSIRLDQTIGLDVPAAGGGEVELRRLHPHERILGRGAYGEAIDVEVHPFRSCLLMATSETNPELGVEGCDYEIVRDTASKPILVKLLGLPGTSAEVRISPGARNVVGVELDGEAMPGLADGRTVRIDFPGAGLAEPWHRMIGKLESVDVPDDAESLYEATCFAADNNALEVRELERSGPSLIPEVRHARDAFFSQPLFRRRHIHDAHMFDDDPDTAFAVGRRWSDPRIRGGSFRLDLGAPRQIDRLVLEVGNDYCLQPLKSEEVTRGSVSSDLKSWREVLFSARENVEVELPSDSRIRYIRMDKCPDRIAHVRGYFRGRELERTQWRASNLFGTYQSARAIGAWSLRFRLDEVPPGSYLAIAVNGRHGRELAYAALRAGGNHIGAPRRSPSYPSNTWECPVRSTDGNYTYYIPVTQDVAGSDLDAVVLLLRGGSDEIAPEAWITAYPDPYVARTLILRTRD